MNPDNTEPRRILVLEPDEQLSYSIRDALAEAAPGALIELAPDLQLAQQLVLGVKPDLFVLDIDAAQDLGQDFLYDLRTSHPNARAIVLTGTHLPAHREQAVGLGAIHFLEKPFPHGDFVELVRSLLRPDTKAESEKFQGTLRDLHIADVIQLKCMSGANSAVEFTGPGGEKARVFFEHGQVRHATSPGREGLAAFNQIIGWKGGTISEVADPGTPPKTIDLDWQVLMMEATRKLDESDAARKNRPAAGAGAGTGRKLLVIDDSVMLLSFVKEILMSANFEVVTAASGEEGLRSAEEHRPDLILLDFVLPGMRGDEVCRKLLENEATARIPIVYMSGFAADLRPEETSSPNVIGFLNKPFTSDLLIETVENHMTKPPEDSSEAAAQGFATEPEAAPAEFAREEEPARPEEVPAASAPADSTEESAPGGTTETTWWTAAPSSTEATRTPADSSTATDNGAAAGGLASAVSAMADATPNESVTGGMLLCGDTSFFSLHLALATIAAQKLTGRLELFSNPEPLELLTQNGGVVLVTTKDPDRYCPEAPVTLANVDPGKIAQARDQQRENGCPLFLTLAQENLILHEPAAQLVQHHGQKVFAQLWTAAKVRFAFHPGEIPAYARDIPAEADIDQWALATLRLIQFLEVGNRANYDASSIPAYTREGYERVQKLRLTVAEAQFASQFNGNRSIQQIAKNLRLDLKFARLTLFRFIALEIVECWPASTAVKTEGPGVLQRLARTIGIGE